MTMGIARPFIVDIQREMCAVFGITLEDMLGPCRRRKLVIARHEAMRRARTRLNASPTRIARAFRRDHTTVLYALGELRSRSSRALEKSR